MRADRLLSVLLLLQSRGRMSAAALATELEVSVRTVYRDIEALSGAGIPIYAERGVTGGFALLEGYSTKLTGLTEQEARALLFSGIPGAATELGLGQVLAAAELKISAALPAGLRGRAGEIRERFLLDPHGWFRTGDEVPHLNGVAEAVWERRRIRVRYRRWDGSAVTRTLDPLGLVLKAGTWYLVATARAREPRIYRVARVQRLETLDQPFEAPAAFDLRQYWERRDEQLRERLHGGYAVVRLSPHARRVLVSSSPSLRDDELEMLRTESSGWVTVRLPIENEAHALGRFLALGAGCEVLEPGNLRDAVAAELELMGQLYRSGAPTSTLARATTKPS